MINNDKMVCPFCGETYPLTTSSTTSIHQSYIEYYFNFSCFGVRGIADKSKEAFRITMTKCPYKKCGKPTITIDHITDMASDNKEAYIDNSDLIHQVMPKCNAKPFPKYVPQHIISDYREAITVLDMSPKASAVLSRRCIDEIITNHFGVTGGSLYDKINAIKNKVSGKLLDAIDSLRKIGNLGAHLKIESNVIVEVSKEEAKAFLWLIEYIIDEWYVQEHEKAEMIEKIAQLEK
ncbi:MAG: DUF4145 domain-containing protein [Ruminiclostridium sp.]|nr:DUF4145 domain-containing protein [Ruminiclostridium sp.]